ncbi:TonB C-terminal domain-containing protein [Massilia sp. H27-R4]|nr:TonB C-terminal domain-containing protein [Massilia sp. H27-R4]
MPKPSYAPAQAPVGVNIASHQTNANVQTPTRDVGLESDPEQLADDVFQQFLGALTKLRTGHMLYDDALWADELQRCLNDERLLNIAARMGFEARVAYFLAGARQLGHDTLFFAAITVFGWMSDRNRLEKFGHPGAIIDRAIDERNMFHAQQDADRVGQQEALTSLRKPALPRLGELRRLMPHLQTMLARFPVLMKLIADEDAIGRWHEAFAGPATTPTAPATDTGGDRKTGGEARESQRGYGLIFGVMILIFALFTILQPTSAHFSVPPSSSAESVADEAASVNPASPVDSYDSQPLKRAQLEEIASHLNVYNDEERPRHRRVEFEVHLDAGGRFDSLNVLHESGNPRYDDAVRKAIWASMPFAATTPRDFSVTFTMRFAPEVREYEFNSPRVAPFSPFAEESGQDLPQAEMTHSKPLPAPAARSPDDPLTVR